MKPKLERDVRVRLAPSPTGPLHLGTAKTALFNWLFARQNKGKFILRIDDTDKERSEKKYEDQILEGLKWLGLNWDEEIYRQSERTKIYKKYIEKLLVEKKAYYCYCSKEELEAQSQAMIAAGLSAKYNGHCRNLEKPPAGKTPGVIRFRTPEVEIEFKDLIRGKVKFNAALFGDIVIAKNLETVLYNFAATVDDAEMKITHVIRGEDHISNTPKQILFQKALSFETPIYAHLPLTLAPDKSKLSKRYGEVSLLRYRESGYLPEAIVNFLVLLGWHPEDNKEIFSLDELIKLFKIERVQKSGAIFDQEKLNWINGQYIKKLSLSELTKRLEPIIAKNEITVPRELIQKIAKIEQERLKTLNDFIELSDFFFELPQYEVNLLKWKNQSLPDTKIILSKILEIFESIKNDKFIEKTILELLAPLVQSSGRGEVFWPLRVSLSGKIASPDPLVIAEILGKNESLKRLKIAIEKF